MKAHSQFFTDCHLAGRKYHDADLVPYLHIDGYKYWIIEDTYEDIDVINREKES